MVASRVNLRELQAPLKAEYQDNPDAARITLRVKSRASDLTDPLHCAPMVVRFELQLLAELGFGLDLESCAVTGATTGLAYVSPRSGRAVSRQVGEEWRDRLFRLPAFLLQEDAELSAEDIADGFAITVTDVSPSGGSSGPSGLVWWAGARKACGSRGSVASVRNRFARSALLTEHGPVPDP